MNDATFIGSETSKFMLNGTEYLIHNYVLRKMNLFNVFIDTSKPNNNEILKIEWPVSFEIANKIFSCLYMNNFSNFKTEHGLELCIETISFMKYLNIDEKFVIDVCEYMTPRFFVEFMEECKKMNYDQEMKYIYDKLYALAISPNIEALCYIAKHIISSNFPIIFKQEMIVNEIKSFIQQTEIINCDIIFGITYSFQNKNNWKCQDIRDNYDDHDNNIVILDDIIEFYKHFGFTINSYIITHSNFQILEIKINNENIDIDGLIKKCDINGTIGVNISPAIATHITKLLLGSDRV
jgi:hypothetical protein